MKTNKLIQLYSRANLLVDSVFELSIPAKSVLKGGRTVKDVCGFLIPLSGQAIYKVNNTEYHLSPGFILHAGSSMPLSKEVVGDQKWDYILMHYKVIGESESRIYLENKDYGVSLNESQMNKVQELARGLLKLHKRTDLREQLKKKMLLYEFIEYLLQAKYETGLQTDNEKIQFITDYMKEHIDQVVTVSSLADKVGMSDKSFAYMFSKTIGISPKKYLMSLKVKKAERLLLGSDLQVTEIAELVGCDDALYFSRMFKKTVVFHPVSLEKHSEKVHIDSEKIHSSRWIPMIY